MPLVACPLSEYTTCLLICLNLDAKRYYFSVKSIVRTLLIPTACGINLAGSREAERTDLIHEEREH